MTASVFPVGHYGGPRAARAEVHVVRVGWKQHQLDEDAFGVWVLSHGVGEIGKDSWTRDDVIALAEQAGLAEPQRQLDVLLDRGVLAAVPDGPDAEEFARCHRMDALFVGLGNSPDEPDLHAVGVPGIGTAALLDPDCYELWQWGSLAPTVWHNCEVRSSVSGRLGKPLQPTEALTQILGDLRFLIIHGCVYLDVVG
jgi:hypothetical protein